MVYRTRKVIKTRRQKKLFKLIGPYQTFTDFAEKIRISRQTLFNSIYDNKKISAKVLSNIEKYAPKLYAKIIK